MSQYEPLYDSFDRGMQERYVPNARINVSPSVYLPGSDVDMYTGYLKPDGVRRCRTQGKRLEREKLEKEETLRREAAEREAQKRGPRISRATGLMILAVLLFAIGGLVLMEEGVIAERQKELNRLERMIAECRSQNGVLKTQIAEASDAVTICYTAARELNMIPAESAVAVHLVAVDTRPITTAQEQQQALEVIASVQEPEVESTHVPVMASN